jgi:predicted exporter
MSGAASIGARRFRTAAFVVLVIVLAAYAIARVRASADFSAFLPAGATPGQRAMIGQLREGAAGRLLLIELSGAPPQRLAQASRALAAQLSAHSGFGYDANGDPAQQRRDLAFILQHRYLLSATVDAATFTVAGLRAALDRRLEGLYGSAAPLEKELLAADPTGETLAILRHLAPTHAPHSVDGVWFDAGGARALMVASTRAPASDIAGQADALQALQDAQADLGDPSIRLAWSSPGALAVASRARIEHEVRLLSLVSAALIVAVLAWTYRAVRPVLLCAVPAATGLLAGACAVHFGLGRLNAITLAFGATLLGEAVDYPSYLLTQVGHDETPAAARRRVGPLLRLAVLTTACGALALLTSGFPGLVELGTMTVVGIVVAGLCTLWVVADWAPQGLGRALPALRPMRPQPLPLSRPLRWAAVLALLVVVAAVAAQRTPFDDDLAHLDPLPPSFAAHDRQLREALGAPDARSLILVRAATKEDVLERTERLRLVLAQAVAAGEASGFDLASDVLPSAATQARRRAALPPAAQLHDDLAAAIAGTPFRLDTFAPFERDVEAARHAPLLTAGDLAGTALGMRLAALLGQDADGAYAVVPLHGLARPEARAARIAALQDAGVTWLDLRAESSAMLRAYRHQALASTALGIVLIGAVLAIGLRSARRALRLLARVITACALAASLQVAAGVALTNFHLVALLLTIGTGVNYALFAERGLGHAQEASRTLRTLGVVSGTTLCAFGTLAFSSIPVLHALGVTVCTGVIACLAVLAWLDLPARAARPARSP